MKAYCGEVKDDPDLGMEILFANTVREAKKQFIGSEVASQADSFLVTLFLLRDSLFCMGTCRDTTEAVVS